MKLKTREDYVAEFMDAGKIGTFESNPDGVAMVFSALDEELNEFIHACLYETPAKAYKEWADLQYVVSQAAVYFDIPAEDAFIRVHENNMTKVVDGVIKKRPDGKILKPDNYVPCDLSDLV